jgi:methylated-DNA-protein-cysteine methyltransferase related protein
VRRIPKGRVATYGQIACLAGIPRQPRQVGYALAALRDDHPVPWHRVVNSKGAISQRSESGFEELQRILLEGEGVVFDAKGRISLSRFRWRPKGAIHCYGNTRFHPSG